MSATAVDEELRVPGTVARIRHYANWVRRCRIGSQRLPLTATLILTDRCNLSCRHCVVAHLGYSLNRFEAVRRDLDLLYRTGARVLVVTGGEPFVWRDGRADLESVLTEARRMGFFRIVVCTNGTFPLESSADSLWVSLDGIPSDHEALRTSPAGVVVENVRASQHGRIYVNFVISALNRTRIEEGAEAILGVENVRGILFHLFTPYLGADRSLLLTSDERHEAIRTVHRLKLRHPVRVTNTLAGLSALDANTWPRPLWSSVTVNQGELTPCCCRRDIADGATCALCGCTPAVETHVLERLRPTAVLDYLRFL
jgi:Fe-coproporphyrin III synthase